mmetsp:Transcript_75991/g.163074  ORF Transcript_75991/g.163074 Transcript_75991/m.163074 type:complete len:262 (+) Transcript_75991:59-844(+)
MAGEARSPQLDLEEELTCEDDNSLEEEEHPAKNIPHRMQQVLLNWIFVVASVCLILDFLSLQDLLRPDKGSEQFAELCNWFGVVSCIGWLLGFILLTHWFQTVGVPKLTLLTGYIRIVASILFNLQPLTGTMNDPAMGGGFSRGGGAGIWWSNLAGILFFHAGNFLACVSQQLYPAPGYEKAKGWFFHGNLVYTANWVLQGATWLLVASNLMACHWGNGAASWVPTTDPVVFVCQVGGATSLLIGSLIYLEWCNGFRDCAH